MAKPTTNCMSLTVAERVVHHFKVEEYSFAKQAVVKDDQYFQSDTFSVGGHDFAMRFYPNHCNSSSVSFCLVLLSELEGYLRVVFAFTLLDKSGKPLKQLEKKLCESFESLTGYGFFVRKKVLESDFLTEDSFVVQCTISVLKRPI